MQLLTNYAILLASILLLFSCGVKGQDLPSLYQYFSSPDGENATGLIPEKDGFILNGKQIRIVSGAMHYFRIHPQLWRDRLRKLRATGANTVETYVPWNLHEPEKDVWDFGEGDHDFSLFLDVRRFIQMAQEEDLLVLFRPGPFICSEFEFGGLPSYLLRDPDMKVRTAYPPYQERAKAYLDQLLPRVADLQFTLGGSIIGLQLENEYGSYDEIQPEHLFFLRQTYLENGITSLLFTSDGAWHGTKGGLPGVFKTINFGSNPETSLNDLLEFQPELPAMVMEFWCGWFDHWFEEHSTTDVEEFAQILEVILGPFNGSVNFYMFHGGTSFGFNPGSNHAPGHGVPNYGPDVTSYDYDGPLSESGDYTPKYYAIMEAVNRYQIPPLRRPLLPPQNRKVAYPPLPRGAWTYLTYSDIIERIPPTAKTFLEDRVSMEQLPINSGSGQSQGYVIYRKVAEISENQRYLNFTAGPVRDMGMLLVDSDHVPYPTHPNGSVQYWMHSVQEYNLSLATGEHTLDLMIENMGRVNFGDLSDFDQRKGLIGRMNPIGEEWYHLDGEEIQGIEVISVEMKSAWVKNLTGWQDWEDSTDPKGPVMVQASFTVEQVADTFIDMSGWGKGLVLMNGFNLGRFFSVGPQQALYCPGPFLVEGENTITIFEQFKAGEEIRFSASPKLGRNVVQTAAMGHGMK